MVKFGAEIGYFLKNGDARIKYITFKVPFDDRHDDEVIYALARARVNKLYPASSVRSLWTRPWITEYYAIDHFD